MKAHIILMKVLVKVTCMLPDLGFTSVGLHCSLYVLLPIKHFISKLMTEPHWLILSTSHGLNFQTHRYRLGCALTIKFTAFLFFNINDVLY